MEKAMDLITLNKYLAEIEKQAKSIQLNPIRKTICFYKGMEFIISEDIITGKCHILEGG
jgi:hypothetical protein